MSVNDNGIEFTSNDNINTIDEKISNPRMRVRKTATEAAEKKISQNLKNKSESRRVANKSFDLAPIAEETPGDTENSSTEPDSKMSPKSKSNFKSFNINWNNKKNQPVRNTPN